MPTIVRQDFSNHNAKGTVHERYPLHCLRLQHCIMCTFPYARLPKGTGAVIIGVLTRGIFRRYRPSAASASPSPRSA